jgi:hypothetical protein
MSLSGKEDSTKSLQNRASNNKTTSFCDRDTFCNKTAIPPSLIIFRKTTLVEKQKCSETGWDGMVYLEPSIVGELSHWTRKLKSRIPRKIIKEIAPQATIITDAAHSGWGATIVE